MGKAAIVVGMSALTFHCRDIDQGKSQTEYPIITWRVIRYVDRKRARHDDKGEAKRSSLPFDLNFAMPVFELEKSSLLLKPETETDKDRDHRGQ